MEGLIVSFTHSNYCIKPTGTEKFVRNLSKILKENNYNHLNFFSFYTDSTIVGVNYNDKFCGIYEYDKIIDIILFYARENNYRIKMLHFQHILNHKTSVLKQVVKKLKVPVCFVLHDYYLICNQLKLIDSNNEFCGVTRPSEEKCKCCAYRNEGINHFESMQSFLKDINSYIYRIIAPSNYVAEKVKLIFPEFRNRIVVRPHLILTGEQEYKEEKSKIKLAYVGAQMKEKGYDDWKVLVETIRENCPDAYELYYFGTGKQEIENVTNIYVSISEQGDNAMINNLRKYGIECAFVWPNWAETYSYVYYELALCGVFIISNDVSGNIYSEITKNKNGLVFQKRKEAVEWLLNIEDVQKRITEYKLNGAYRPQISNVNTDLSDFLSSVDILQTVRMDNKPKTKVLKSIMYRVKYRKFHL
ncbi:MAG: hypothetical protein ACLTBR_10785 [Anaerostipes sp.]|uniref:hypothetical protein n=1 Tax=Anaerostipes sp. TaxID=1872530 RepID=UPI003995F561